MNKFITPLFLFFVSTVSSFGQGLTLAGQQTPAGYSADVLDSIFHHYEVYSIELEAVLERLAATESGLDVRLHLNQAHSWDFQLDRVALTSSDYKVRRRTASGYEPVEVPRVHTFQGKTESGGLVALSVSEEFVYGFFKVGGTTWFIQPVWLLDHNAGRQLFLLYRAGDVKPGEQKFCAVKDLTDPPLPLPHGNERITNSCLEAEVAIASDYYLFTTLGSTSAVTTWVTGTLNNVAVNYRHEFTDNIELELVEQFVDDALPHEWTTSTSASDLLNDFTAWGPTGFSATHDLATLWSGRDFDGSTIGLAWVDAVCSSSRYNVCEYQGTTWVDRVLQAHEMGHNFSAGHDASGSPYIMAPAINNTEEWSAASVSSFDSSLPSYTCLATCTGSPVPLFLADPVVVCTGSAVQFKDKSQNSSTRSWTFSNGTPGTSTAQQPSVTYAATGTNDVSITATGSGSNTLTETDYITVDDPTTASCTTSGGSGGLTYFSLNTISNSTSTGAYTDYSCSDLTTLTANTSYCLAVTIYCPTNSEFKGIRFFIDYNNDGDLSGAGELVATSTFLWCGGVVDCVDDSGLSFTTSSAPTTGQILRSRVIVNRPSPSTDPCQTLTEGEAEDYGVYFAPGALPVELVDFGAKAEGEKVRLYWTTANEQNNSHFTVQRAQIGVLFEDLGRVEATTTPTGLNHYSFVDQAPLDGVNYYRLRQSDYDGSTAYSGVVAVKMQRKQQAYLAPNPAGGQVEIVNAAQAGVHRVALYSMTGALLLSRQYDSGPLDVSMLEPGVYLVELQTDSGSVHHRLVLR